MGNTGEQRFFADSMLGKLARWMRTLGYDVAYDPYIDDGELVMRALEEGRTILTRDTRLIQRRSARGRAFFITGDHVGEQLKQVIREFPPDEKLLLTRCLRCNVPLVSIPKEKIEERVPPYVFRTQSEFSECPSCRRIYWGATHKAKMLDDLKKLLE